VSACGNRSVVSKQRWTAIFRPRLRQRPRRGRTQGRRARITPLDGTLPRIRSSPFRLASDVLLGNRLTTIQQRSTGCCAMQSRLAGPQQASGSALGQDIPAWSFYRACKRLLERGSCSRSGSSACTVDLKAAPLRLQVESVPFRGYRLFNGVFPGGRAQKTLNGCRYRPFSAAEDEWRLG
jgi:hypothetical protein